MKATLRAITLATAIFLSAGTDVSVLAQPVPHAADEAPDPNDGSVWEEPHGPPEDAPLRPRTWTRIIQVDDEAVGAATGANWTDAYPHLQDALAEAARSTKPVEIRVAQGVYRPDASSAHPEYAGDRIASFHLVDRVAIKGGYAGLGATDPNVRDISLYETILSGDLAGDDTPVLDPCDLLTEPTRAENSYAVVTAVPCSRSAVLDGFTISSGNAIGTNRHQVDQNGGGLVLSCYGADCCPSIRNCTFIGNCAYRGGAVYVIGARPELVNCKFLDNAAIEGGAILTSAWRDLEWHVSDCDFVIGGCVFANNYARDAGGAIHTGAGAPFKIEGSTFTKNFAGTGGALHDSVGANIAHCLFAHNVADQTGGAVYSDGYKLNVASCTFAGNTAPAGRALTCFTPVTTITNSIFWNGGDERHAEIHMGSITGMDLTHSNVQGGWPPGEGNIDVAPLFAPTRTAETSI